MKLKGGTFQGFKGRAKPIYNFGNVIDTFNHFGAFVPAISIPHWTGFNLSGGNFAISLWIKIIGNTSAEAGWHQVIHKANAFLYQTWKGWMISAHTGSGGLMGDYSETNVNIRFYIGDSASSTYNVPLITNVINHLGKWHHLVVNVNEDLNQIEGWWNGRLVGVTTFTSMPNFDNTNDIGINETAYSYSAKPDILYDDIAIYSRVLKPSEITDMYSLEQGSVIPNDYLVYYKCDSSSGTTLTDESANARHGTVSGTENTIFRWSAH